MANMSTSSMGKPFDSPIGQENHLRYQFYFTIVTLAYFCVILLGFTLSNLLFMWPPSKPSKLYSYLVKCHAFTFICIYLHLSTFVSPFVQMFVCLIGISVVQIIKCVNFLLRAMRLTSDLVLHSTMCVCAQQ